MQSLIHAFIRHGVDGYYVAECVELPVVTQGATLDEAVCNLHEAVTLHLEDEDISEMGLQKPIHVQIIYELELSHAAT